MKTLVMNKFTAEHKAAYYSSWRGIEIEAESVKWRAVSLCVNVRGVVGGGCDVQK